MPACILSALAGCVCFLSLDKQKIPPACFLFWALALGAQSYSVRAILSASNVVDLSGAENITIKGTLASDLLEEGAGGFVFQAHSFEAEKTDKPVYGKIWVSLRALKSRELVKGECLVFGDKLEISGRLSSPNGFTRRFLSRKRADAVLYARTVKKEGWNRKFFAFRAAFLLRKLLFESLERHHAPACASILEAMLLGLKKEMPEEVRSQSIRAGTWHVFVVSGSHVALAVVTAALFFKIAGIRGRLRLFLTILFVWMYCLACGASAPVLRSAIMATVFLLFFYAKKPALFSQSFPGSAGNSPYRSARAF